MSEELVICRRCGEVQRGEAPKGPAEAEHDEQYALLERDVFEAHQGWRDAADQPLEEGRPWWAKAEEDDALEKHYTRCAVALADYIIAKVRGEA